MGFNYTVVPPSVLQFCLGQLSLQLLLSPKYVQQFFSTSPISEYVRC